MDGLLARLGRGRVRPHSAKRTMTPRRWLFVADAVVVVALAGADRWLVDEGAGALAMAVVILAPLVAWAYVAPTPAWAWSVSAVLLGVLLAAMWTSRVPLSEGPAAPPIDWLLPYLAGSVVICAFAMTVRRRWPWKPVAALAALVVAASCWAFGTWALEGDGSHVDYLPAREAAPLTSGLVIDDTGRTHCSENGAACDRPIYVRTDLTAAEVRDALRSYGWSEGCRRVTGILSHLDLYRYGYRCLAVHGSLTPGVVVISLLGQADWWFHSLNDPAPIG